MLASPCAQITWIPLFRAWKYCFDQIASGCGSAMTLTTRPMAPGWAALAVG
jgi:hypothetical protein